MRRTWQGLLYLSQEGRTLAYLIRLISDQPKKDLAALAGSEASAKAGTGASAKITKLRLITKTLAIPAMIPRLGLFKSLYIFSNKDQMKPFKLQIKTIDLHNFILKSYSKLTSLLVSSRQQKECPFRTTHFLVYPVALRLSR